MVFQDAIKLLQDGKILCRDAWTLEDGYLTFMKGMTHIWKIVLKPTPNAGNYIFSVEDIISSDWKEFEMPESAIEGVIV